jgi:hypothetical protein
MDELLSATSLNFLIHLLINSDFAYLPAYNEGCILLITPRLAWASRRGVIFYYERVQVGRRVNIQIRDMSQRITIISRRGDHGGVVGA